MPTFDDSATFGWLLCFFLCELWVTAVYDERLLSLQTFPARLLVFSGTGRPHSPKKLAIEKEQ